MSGEMTGRRLGVIVGVGEGISASFARALAREGFGLVLAARNTAKLGDLAGQTGARVVACDAAEPSAVAALFDALLSVPEVVLYNASGRVRGPLVELDPEAVRRAIETTAFGAFLVGQAAARRMLARPGGASGTILFTGASAGVKGFSRSAAFAMGKFALRGLAQSMSRELHPLGIHVCHVVIDGGVRSESRLDPPDRRDATLDPEAIAEAYLGVMRQPRSAWTDELALRPWVEPF